jgi:succinyl-CoA synthetase beta subunit
MGLEKPMNLISEALAQGRSALSEHESKEFLKEFGIAVSREETALDPESAALCASRIGFPVVLKAAGPALFHKTEVEGVVLNLRGEDDVQREAERLLKIPGCESLLVQETVKGGRELVCGLTRDALFGPCVMFGLGGILTEVLEDTVFRLAPLSDWDAREMVTEIRGAKILDPFRGEAAVDLNVLAGTLVALGEIALKHEDVREIDINPLKIRPDGKPVAVDALVVLKGPA